MGFTRLLEFLKNPWLQTAINCTLITAAYVGNKMEQVFCQPVSWAGIVLIVTFIPVVFWPLLRLRWPKWHPVWQFLRGLAFCICIYSIIFLGWLNLAIPMLAMTGIGLLGLVPHFFAIHILFHIIFKPDWVQRGFFLVGIGMSMCIACYWAVEYHAAALIVQDLSVQVEEYDGPHAAMVERIVGMHFKYHTKFCEFDGWRPPLHDPALIIGLWTTGMRDPLPLRLDQRIDLYRKVFPELPVQQDCACAWNSYGYFGSDWFDE